MLRAKWAMALTLVTALALPARAQDDDLLAPLPVKEKDAPKEKRSKPKKNKAKPKPVPQPAGDDDLVPLVQAKTELNVQLATSVKGARLFIDDKEAGTFPTGPKAVTAGEHILQVKRVGYAPLSKKIVAAKGKVTDVTLSIEAVAGVLSVESDLVGAEVWVNDKRVGVTPLRDVEVAPGPVEVRVRKEHHRDASEVLTMRAGKDYTLSLTPVAAVAAVTPVPDRPADNGLTPRPALSDSSPLEAPVAAVHSGKPLYERWYFWAGVAAVVAAGVTTAVLVTRPAPGNLLPNKNNYTDWCTGGASCYYWDLPRTGYAGEFSKLR
ncbi:MAG: PEGA domain-containing protein [Myxococcaceae bacterium]|nr:PEGA domain-containing protein [Myxococcaceae bacterium]